MDNNKENHQLDEVYEFVDEVQPKINKLYDRWIREGREESYIMDEILVITRGCIGVIYDHKNPKEKLEKLLLLMTESIARTIFLEARADYVNEYVKEVKQ